MKKTIALLFGLALMGATAANAGIGVGVHVGGIGAGVHVGVGHHHRAPHCVAWGWRHHHHQHYCVRWSR